LFYTFNDFLFFAFNESKFDSDSLDTDAVEWIPVFVLNEVELDLEHIALQDGFVAVERVVHDQNDGADHVRVHRLVLVDVHGLQQLLNTQQNEVEVFERQDHVDDQQRS